MHMSNKSLLVSALTRFVHLARAREAKPSDGPDSAHALGGAGDFVLMK